MDVGTDISAGSTSNHNVAALLHLYSIVVEMHDSGLLRKNIDMAAEGDDVVAAGDSGEDARLDVHLSISASQVIGVVELNTDSVVVHDSYFSP